eukprot:1335734-Amorphochlora_amoeboformis.AAC.1
MERAGQIRYYNATVRLRLSPRVALGPVRFRVRLRVKFQARVKGRILRIQKLEFGCFPHPHPTAFDMPLS